MDWNTVAIVSATLFGPVLAVQAERWLERGRATKERRLEVFRRLMANRASVLSPLFVDALNAVPIEFFGKDDKLIKINDAWKLYFDHHAQGQVINDAWSVKRRDLLLDLLHLMSQFLGYGFSRAQLSADIYSPEAYSQFETENTIIRRGLVGLFNGDISLPLAVKEMPAGDAEVQAAMQGLLADALAKTKRKDAG